MFSSDSWPKSVRPPDRSHSYFFSLVLVVAPRVRLTACIARNFWDLIFWTKRMYVKIRPHGESIGGEKSRFNPRSGDGMHLHLKKASTNKVNAARVEMNQHRSVKWPGMLDTAFPHHPSVPSSSLTHIHT